MTALRPALLYLLFNAILLLIAGGFIAQGIFRSPEERAEMRVTARVVADLGLSDLAISTEARYTRHPAVTDRVVVTMDHPGGIDHFPSTLFLAPGP